MLFRPFSRIVAVVLLQIAIAAWPSCFTLASEATSDTQTAVRAIPAFPGAEGGGAYATGGRGGKVYEVTTLDLDAPGGLREAIKGEGPRIVVFRVGGAIDLKGSLFIQNPHITIAGQTAPGDGICLSSGSLQISTSDVVLRYLRVRGSAPWVLTNNALGGGPVKDVIVDHCSCSWAADENISLYRLEDWDKDFISSASQNVTVQWCISSETAGFRRRPFGGVIGGTNSSYHHNLFACNISWAPWPTIAFMPPAKNLDVRNNVFYAWRDRKIEGAQLGTTLNLVANYYLPDPTLEIKDDFAFFKTDGRFHRPAQTPDDLPPLGKWYVAKNFVPGCEKVSKDNWAGPTTGKETKQSDVRVDKPFPCAPITEQTAQEAFTSVLASAGASLPVRDSVDLRVIDAVRNKKTYYGKVADQLAPEYYILPEYKTAVPSIDSDHDAMPDEWEKKYGLNPDDATDGKLDKDADGYTNVEECLNGTDPTVFVDYTDSSNNVNMLHQEKPEEKPKE